MYLLKLAVTITEVFPEDEGHYSCKAVNIEGEITSTCQLLVEGRLHPPDNFVIFLDATYSIDSASISSASSLSRGKKAVVFLNVSAQPVPVESGIWCICCFEFLSDHQHTLKLKFVKDIISE